MSWLIENKEWVFSGIGVSVLFFVLSLFKKNFGSKQVQKSGANSTNYQAGGDINIGSKHDK
ncbi:hypothetical protein [Oceanimonas smirnovii]|uniref:hypothetical protein n=1 Tax=Oceanimonas smirnovii TaxID=264574 RepID=UPI003FD27735